MTTNVNIFFAAMCFLVLVVIYLIYEVNEYLYGE